MSTNSNNKRERNSRVAIFYGGSTGKTAEVAKKIQQALGDSITVVDIKKAWKEDFEAYDNLIIGVSTWFDGELPTDWDELLPELEIVNMKNKKVAIFGLGDQAGYPDNFADGIGILAHTFTNAGAALVGFTSPEGYTFNQSLALKDGMFQGLVIDEENQADKTDERIKKWIEVITTSFKT